MPGRRDGPVWRVGAAVVSGRSKRRRGTGKRRRGKDGSSPTQREATSVSDDPKKSAVTRSAPPNAQGPVESPQVLVQTELQGYAFRGPLPPPEILQAYENALPGAAERIVAMAEIQHSHRLARQGQSEVRRTDRLASDISLKKRGQLMAFLLALACAVLIWFDKPAEWYVAALAILAGATGVSILSRRANREQSPPASGEAPDPPARLPTPLPHQPEGTRTR